ncbi:hypothetical protein EKO04_010335 [Ascochyta lentis]|uniref:Ricin B lectin domain-containing protein n=1 Tax=Ascochyta lentis TaxID=205686 RepID=A0A8H7MFU2_9PLEO|nr:hypothetical protein EKO04_010335 [Ascochyta lentis]
MSSSNLDTNKWYSLYVNNDNSSSLLGTNLYNRAGTTGALFFNKTDPEIATQRWQLYPVNTPTGHLHHSKPMQTPSPHPQSVAYEPYKGEIGPVLPEPGSERFKAELEHHGSVAKYEMSGHTVVDLGGREQRKPVELPGQVGRG